MANRRRGNFSLPEELRTEERISTKQESLQRQTLPPPCPKVKKLFVPSANYYEKPKPLYFKNMVSLSSSYNASLDTSYFEQVFSTYKLLGEGSFGKVYRVVNREDNEVYAVKRLKPDVSSSDCYAEVNNNEKVGIHPNIVRFFMAWKENMEVYMLLEYCDISLSDFSNLKSNIPEELLWNILYDICKALHHLHVLGLIHLDVKPGNIMMKNGFFKLADFGILVELKLSPVVSKTLSDGDSKYLALEVLEGIYKPSCDIFGLGISLLELAADLQLPSHGPLWQQLRHEVLPHSFYNRVSLGFQVIIERMLKPEYEERPTAEKILKYSTVKEVEKRDKKQPRIDFAEEFANWSLNSNGEVSDDIQVFINNNNNNDVFSTPPCALDASHVDVPQYSFRTADRISLDIDEDDPEESEPSSHITLRKILFQGDEKLPPQGDSGVSPFSGSDRDNVLATNLSDSSLAIDSISMEIDEKANSDKEKSMEITSIDLEGNDVVTSTPILKVKTNRRITKTKLTFD